MNLRKLHDVPKKMAKKPSSKEEIEMDDNGEESDL